MLIRRNAAVGADFITKAFTYCAEHRLSQFGIREMSEKIEIAKTTHHESNPEDRAKSDTLKKARNILGMRNTIQEILVIPSEQPQENRQTLAVEGPSAS